MKPVVLALAVSALLVAPALAQGDPSTGGVAPMAGAAAGGGKGGKMKAAMQSCRTEVQTQGVKGADRKKAVMDCVTREHPEMAGRMQCRQDGMAKGLSGDELKTFVRSCARSHG